MIFPGVATQSGARIFTGNSTITDDDVDAVRAECPSVAYVTPVSRSAGQIVNGNLNWGTSVQGVGVEWPFVRSWNVEKGAFFSDSDVRAAAKVCRPRARRWRTRSSRARTRWARWSGSRTFRSG